MSLKARKCGFTGVFVACVASGVLGAKLSSRVSMTSVAWDLWGRGLWRGRQSCGKGNGEKGMFSLVPLCVLSGELAGKDLEGGS